MKTLILLFIGCIVVNPAIAQLKEIDPKDMEISMLLRISLFIQVIILLNGALQRRRNVRSLLIGVILCCGGCAYNLSQYEPYRQYFQKELMILRPVGLCQSTEVVNNRFRLINQINNSYDEKCSKIYPVKPQTSVYIRKIYRVLPDENNPLLLSCIDFCGARIVYVEGDIWLSEKNKKVSFVYTWGSGYDDIILKRAPWEADSIPEQREFNKLGV